VHVKLKKHLLELVVAKVLLDVDNLWRCLRYNRFYYILLLLLVLSLLLMVNNMLLLWLIVLMLVLLFDEGRHLRLHHLRMRHLVIVSQVHEVRF
jgi:hypothetical protein